MPVLGKRVLAAVVVAFAIAVAGSASLSGQTDAGGSQGETGGRVLGAQSAAQVQGHGNFIPDATFIESVDA